MKKFSTFLLAVLLVVALAIPTFASEDFPEYPVHDGYNILHYMFGDNNFLVYYKAVNSVTLSSDGTVKLAYRNFILYELNSGIWNHKNTSAYNETATVLPGAHVFTNTQQLITSDGTLALDTCYRVPMPGEVTECDGSACPATDADHDNVCDDCGKVLTMSLRSTLMDYARSVIENGINIFNAQYWLITEDSDTVGYKIYVAVDPFKYSMSNGILASDGNAYYVRVYEAEDGSYKGGTGWQTKNPGTPLEYGNPVESSHIIHDFFPEALWEEMTKISQGAMVAEQIRLNRTIAILVLCGVGCLAFLVVLKLFGRKSLLFRE